MTSKSCINCKHAPEWFRAGHRNYVLCYNPERRSDLINTKIYPTNKENVVAFVSRHDMPCFEAKESEQ